MRELLGVTGLVIIGVYFVGAWFVGDVRPRGRKARCGSRGRPASGYDRQAPRHWRHLGLGRWMSCLRYAPRRVACRRCRGRGEMERRAGAAADPVGALHDAAGRQRRERPERPRAGYATACAKQRRQLVDSSELGHQPHEPSVGRIQVHRG